MSQGTDVQQGTEVQEVKEVQKVQEGTKVQTAIGSGLQQETVKKKKKFQFKKKYVTSAILIGLLGTGGVQAYNLFFVSEPPVAVTSRITYGVLGTVMEGSGSTTPSETQSVSVASTSEVLSVHVTAGEEITAGQLLYIQDDSELDDQIATLYEKIEGYNDTIDGHYDTIEGYNDTIDNYYDTIEDYYDTISGYQEDITDFYADIAELRLDMLELTVKAPFDGKITEISVDEGDTVTSSAKVAQLTSSVELDVVLYFSYAYEGDIYVGQSATVSIPTQMLTLSGKVTKLSMVEYITKEGTKCFAVTITVPNPGALASGTEVSATIGTMYPVEAGTLNHTADVTLTPPVAGTIVDVFMDEYLNVVTGQTLYTMDTSSIETQIENVYTSITDTQTKISDTQERIVDTEELIVKQQEKISEVNEKIADVRLDIADVHLDIADVELERGDFQVYSEISGKVISVNVREGANPAGNAAAAVIYNLDTMEFSANIDELDMEHVYLGMDVEITYSSGSTTSTFTGTVSSMSYEATNSNGVAYFPIMISVDSMGAIASGVNVSYKISVGDTAEGYLVPVDALKQVDGKTCVYIEGTGTSEVEVAEGEMPEGYYAKVVEIATSNSSYALVEEGLSEGMTVFNRFQTVAPNNGNTTSETGTQNAEREERQNNRENAGTNTNNNAAGGTTTGPQGRG